MKQPFHNPVVCAEFPGNVPGSVRPHFRKRLDEPLEAIRWRLPFPESKHHVAQEQLPAFFQHPRGIAQGHKFPRIGQMMQRQAGDHRIKTRRREVHG